jgi:hypothetical protein
MDEGQLGQGTGDADPFVGGAEVEADAPGEPLGAGLEPVAPAAEGVELAELVQEARHGDLDVGGELGELIAQALGGDDVGMKCALARHAALLAWRNSRGRIRRALAGAPRGDHGRRGISARCATSFQRWPATGRKTEVQRRLGSCRRGRGKKLSMPNFRYSNDRARRAT